MTEFSALAHETYNTYWMPDGRPVEAALTFPEAYAFTYNWGTLHVTEEASALYGLERRAITPRPQRSEADGLLPHVQALLLTPDELDGVAAARGLEQTRAYPRARWAAEHYREGMAVGVALESIADVEASGSSKYSRSRRARLVAAQREPEETQLSVISSAIGEAAAQATFNYLHERGRRRDMLGLLGFLCMEAGVATGALYGGAELHANQPALATLLGAFGGVLLSRRHRTLQNNRKREAALLANQTGQLQTQVQDDVYATFVDKKPPKAAGTGPIVTLNPKGGLL